MEETVYSTAKHRIELDHCRTDTGVFVVRVYRHGEDHIAAVYTSEDWADVCDMANSFIQRSIECEGCFIADAYEGATSVEDYLVSA